MKTEPISLSFTSRFLLFECIKSHKLHIRPLAAGEVGVVKTVRATFAKFENLL